MTNENGVVLDYELSPSERKEVRERYPNTYFPDPVKEPLWYGRRDHRRIPDKKVICDQNAQADAEGNTPVFGICSERYKVIHYEDIIYLVENSVGAITGFGKIQLKPHTYLDGARLNIGIGFPDMKYEVKTVGSITPKIEVFSSYDLSTKLMGRFGAFQLRCTNGMGVWEHFRSFARRHLQNLFLNDLGEVISGGMEIFGEQVDQWRLWTEKKVTPILFQAIFDELPFSKTEQEKIKMLPEIGTNLVLDKSLQTNSLDLWSVNSVLTQYTTHEVKSELRRIDLEPIIANVMERAFNKELTLKPVTV